MQYFFISGKTNEFQTLFTIADPSFHSYSIDMLVENYLAPQIT